jgi:hypothetical protein
MSMCHFCFRCRRPSCPNCWDTVHSICGQCAHETQVPFRLEIPPLSDTPSLTQYSMNEYPISSSMHPGRFQKSPFSPSIDSISTRPDPLSSPKVHSPAQSAGTFVPSPPVDIDRIKTRPDRNNSLDVDTIKTRPDHTRSLDIDTIKTHPDYNRSLNDDKLKTSSTPSNTGKRKIARILTSITFLLLLLIVIAISAVFISMNINIFIDNALHIDIRTELISLWHFLLHLF